MKQILIVAATGFEIGPFLSAAQGISKFREAGITSCHFKNIPVDILVTGVGMVATAYHLGKALAGTKYDMAFNLGIAGSFNTNLAIGDVVNIIMDRFPEKGAQDGDSFLSLTDLNLMKPNDFPYTNGELINESIIESATLKNLPMVNGITVNTVHGNENSIAKTISLYHPVTESMEGAAFLYGCMVERIPCAQIRAISNYVERRNKDAWNIPLAVQNLNELAFEVLNELNG